MKIKNLFLGSLACLAFAACSNDDDAATTGLGDKYVALNIVTASEATRASAGAGDFENGTDAENAADKALVVFYNGSTYHSSNTVDLTWANPGTNDNDVAYEAKTEAVIVMENPASLPNKMIVVLNAPAELTSNIANYTLTQLKALAGEYGTTGASGTFIMSNSVWGNNCEVAMETSDFKTSADLAKESPLDVYVERIVARVDVKQDAGFTGIDPVDGTGENKILVNKYNSSVDGNFEQNEVTVTTTLLGYHLAATNQYSYLLKNLPNEDLGWNGTSLDWNDDNDKRSYWAKSYRESSGPAQAKLYNKFYTEKLSGETAKTFYCQENTETENATKLVFTAQHKFDDGVKSLIQYRGTMYFYEADFIQFAAKGVRDAGYTYDGVSGNDWAQYLKVQRAASATDSKKWLVDVVLDQDALDDASITLDPAVEAGINDVLTTYKDAWEWQNGKAYYFIDIAHLNQESAVVRNHLYTLNIQSISGLGTPVYDPNDDGDEDPDDPEEPIVPEKPTDESFQVAAQIYVLKWRMVPQQNVQIGW